MCGGRGREVLNNPSLLFMSHNHNLYNSHYYLTSSMKRLISVILPVIQMFLLSLFRMLSSYYS